MTAKTKKTIKFIILFFALLFLGLFLRHVDFQEVYANIERVGWRFLWILLVTGIGFLLGSTAWFFCFRRLELPNTTWQLFVFRMIGESLSMVNPASIVAGDALKVYLLKERGVPVEEGSSATLISRILLAISLVVIIIFAAIFFLDTQTFFGNAGNKILVILLLALWVIGSLYLFVSPKMYIYRLVKFIFSKFSDRAAEKTQALYEVNFAMADYFKNYKKKFFFAFFFSILHWLSGALEFFVILWLIDIPISLLDSIIMETGVMVVKSIGAFVPGQVGVEEKGNELMLGIIGINTAGIWVVVSILRRARQIFWLLIGGLLYLKFAINSRQTVA